MMEFYGRQLRRVYFDLKLDEMLQEFREARSHIALVWKVRCRVCFSKLNSR